MWKVSHLGLNCLQWAYVCFLILKSLAFKILYVLCHFGVSNGALTSGSRFLPYSIVPFILFGTVVSFWKTDDLFLFWFAQLFTWCNLPILIYHPFLVWRYILRGLATLLRLVSPCSTVQKTLRNKDVTIVIPTISVSDNPAFEKCVQSAFMRGPAAVHIVTDTPDRALEVTEVFTTINTFGIEYRILFAGEPDKRRQLMLGVKDVDTRITLCMDDHAWLTSELDPAVQEFEKPEVGLCGSLKSVEIQVPKATTSRATYWKLLWNVLGALYLVRHNTDIQLTNAIDGGVFVISGRMFLILTDIMRGRHFKDGFLNERTFSIGRFQGKKLLPDDDNYITRYVADNGYTIKVVSVVMIRTTLGEFPRFLPQCVRWTRTRLRQNIKALLQPRLWARWPITIPVAYIWPLFNIPLLWEPLMIVLLMRTRLYLEAENRGMYMCALCVWIYWTKIWKFIPFLMQEENLWILFYFFVIPISPLFGYVYGLIQFFSLGTWWKSNWGGRNLELKIKAN